MYICVSMDSQTYVHILYVSDLHSSGDRFEIVAIAILVCIGLTHVRLFLNRVFSQRIV